MSYTTTHYPYVCCHCMFALTVRCVMAFAYTMMYDVIYQSDFFTRPTVCLSVTIHTTTIAIHQLTMY